MARTNSYDLKIIIDLINRINFLKSSMEEHVLVAGIERELAKHFEFQVSYEPGSTIATCWSYYIRCSIPYPWTPPPPSHNSRLTSLLTNLEFLRDTALNKE